MPTLPSYEPVIEKPSATEKPSSETRYSHIYPRLDALHEYKKRMEGEESQRIENVVQGKQKVDMSDLMMIVSDLEKKPNVSEQSKTTLRKLQMARKNLLEGLERKQNGAFNSYSQEEVAQAILEANPADWKEDEENEEILAQRAAEHIRREHEDDPPRESYEPLSFQQDPKIAAEIAKAKAERDEYDLEDIQEIFRQKRKAEEHGIKPEDFEYFAPGSVIVPKEQSADTDTADSVSIITEDSIKDRSPVSTVRETIPSRPHDTVTSETR